MVIIIFIVVAIIIIHDLCAPSAMIVVRRRRHAKRHVFLSGANVCFCCMTTKPQSWAKSSFD